MKKNEFIRHVSGMFIVCLAVMIVYGLTSPLKGQTKVVPYADSTFLEVKGNLHDPEIIWGSVDTYLKASHRMNRFLYVKDNRLKWNLKNGAEIKISENIFDYVVFCWKMENDKLETGNFEIVKQEGKPYFVMPKNRSEDMEVCPHCHLPKNSNLTR